MVLEGGAEFFIYNITFQRYSFAPGGSLHILLRSRDEGLFRLRAWAVWFSCCCCCCCCWWWCSSRNAVIILTNAIQRLIMNTGGGGIYITIHGVVCNVMENPIPRSICLPFCSALTILCSNSEVHPAEGREGGREEGERRGKRAKGK